MSVIGPVRTVLLDLDGTVLSEGATALALGGVARAVAAEQGVDPVALGRALEAFWLRAWTDEVELTWSRGLLTRDMVAEAWADALRVLGVLDPAVALDAVARHRAAEDDAFTAFDDVAPLVDLLDRAGMPVVVVTNGDSSLQRRKLRALGLADRVAVAASGDDGVVKPDPRIFERALALGAGRPAVHVGDSLPSDVGGALAAGITAVWLDRHGRSPRPGEPRPDHVISSLAELPALLGLA